MGAERTRRQPPGLAAALLAGLLAAGCGGSPEERPAEALASPEAAAETAVASAAAPAAEPASEEPGYRLVPPGPPWVEVATFAPLPEASLVLERPPAELRFALIPVGLAAEPQADRTAVETAAEDYLRRRANVLEIEEQRPFDLRGLPARMTVAQGFIDNKLVRLVDVQVTTATGAFHLLTWAPLLELDPEGLKEVAADLASRFELLDPDLALDLVAAPAPMEGRGGTRILDFDVVDAAYSRALDRLVILSEHPPAVRLVDPVTLREEVVDLELVPLRVALDPDGRQAAVSHHGRLSLIDLERPRLVMSRKLTIDPGHLVFTGRGWVYTSAARKHSFEKVIGASLPGSAQVESRGHSIHGDAMLRVHPDGQSLYVANRRSYPESLEKLDISDATPRHLYRWPYHGEHAPCGGLWISADGRRIFTACGAVFRTSKARDRDMVFDGQLADAAYFMALEECPTRRLLVALNGKRKGLNIYDDIPVDRVTVYDAESLTVKRVDELPEISVDGRQRFPSVRFAFPDAACDSYHALVRYTAPGAGAEITALTTRGL